MTPYYTDERVTLYHGDALAVLAAMPDASVDAVITDPPYSSGGQYRGDRTQDVHTKYVQTTSASGRALTDFAGDGRDQRAYAYWCTLWLSEALRVTKPGGACLLFTDWRQLPTTTDALQAGGWVWRGIVPWHKPAGRNTAGRFANTCEYIAWGTRGPRAAEDHETLRGFFQMHPPPGAHRVHITQKPVALLRELVHIAPPGGLVLDPFAGSGTTGVAALIEGRHAVLVELTEHYAQACVDRLRTAALRSTAGQGDLFAEAAPPGAHDAADIRRHITEETETT